MTSIRMYLRWSFSCHIHLGWTTTYWLKVKGLSISLTAKGEGCPSCSAPRSPSWRVSLHVLFQIAFLVCTRTLSDGQRRQLGHCCSQLTSIFLSFEVFRCDGFRASPEKHVPPAHCLPRQMRPLGLFHLKLNRNQCWMFKQLSQALFQRPQLPELMWMYFIITNLNKNDLILFLSAKTVFKVTKLFNAFCSFWWQVTKWWDPLKFHFIHSVFLWRNDSFSCIGHTWSAYASLQETNTSQIVRANCLPSLSWYSSHLQWLYLTSMVNIRKIWYIKNRPQNNSHLNSIKWKWFI